jgi:hypothetical protein
MDIDDAIGGGGEGLGLDAWGRSQASSRNRINGSIRNYYLLNRIFKQEANPK